MNGQTSELDLKELSNGMYLINVSSKNASATYKVILLK
ncbi:MAG: T9SS type A sorting domain-containing protein [Sphingobacteriaceae bacterium]|nr:T9SS type A sorting domain-containing protein [Sphingobacteriaceae bacterium]